MKKEFLKSVLTWLGKLCIAGVAVIVVLSVISFFYSYTGIHVTNESGATDYRWQKNQLMLNMKEGFSFVRMDENGFNNAIVPEGGIDILLMGSSHMEAYQVKQEENCAALLNEYLPDMVTYNIGVSGHTIYRLADNIEAALNEYRPEKYVILETNTVSLSINEMQKILDGSASAIKSYDSGVLFYLQKIPAFKPLYNQLENWLNVKIESSDSATAQKVETVIPENYETVLTEFLKSISDSANEYGVVPVIFYAPNESLTGDGELVFQTDEKYYEIYKDVCEETGIVFIDMSPYFLDLYENSNVLAHGFANTAVGVGHLNRYGHKTIAEVLAAEISETEVR
ncbi:MAG: hypothetical protein IJN70_02240 [Clostridia bacterium]|nr:hypothetical protein [Clostridia bacterium]